METEQKRERDEDEAAYEAHDAEVDQEPEKKKQCSFRNGNEAESEREIITSVTKVDNDKVCKIKVNGKYAEKYGNFALCSPQDFEMLSNYSWYWSKGGYAMTLIKLDGKRKGFIMSRLLLKATPGILVDHINRNTYDNRRENLRFATHSQNSQNKAKKDNCSSKYYGVKFNKKRNKFCSTLKIDKKYISLGLFDREIDAAIKYDTYVSQNKEKLGLFHNINFPDQYEYYKTLSPIIPRTMVSKTTFKYVSVGGNKFKVGMVHNKERIHLGRYETAEDAAKAADRYIVEKKLDKKLNFPLDYPNFVPNQEQKLFITNIDLNDQNICNILKDIAQFSPLEDLNPDIDVLVKVGGKNKHKYTLIERKDFETVKYHSTYLTLSGYVKVCKGKDNLGIGRLILDVDDSSLCVDHISSNVLDNRRRFLRVVKQEDNIKNKRKQSKKSSSNYIGVSKREKYWKINVQYNGKSVIQAYLKTEIDAARLRDLFVLQNYPGKYRLNFDDWDDEKTIEKWEESLKKYIKWKKE